MGARFTSYGGINNVTGSAHVYDGTEKIGIDMGAVQGYTQSVLTNAITGIPEKDMPNFYVVTHAHYDHIGKCPLLVKEGFKGPVFCTKETKISTMTTLQDSLIIMEREAGFGYKERLSKLKKDLSHKRQFVQRYGKEIRSGKYHYDYERKKRIEELCNKRILNVDTKYALEYEAPEETLLSYERELAKYNIKGASDITLLSFKEDFMPWTEKHLFALEKLLEVVPYNEKIPLHKNLSVELYNAGHILGSAQLLIRDALYGNTLFTGDLGRIHDPLFLEPPHVFSPEDAIKNLIIEATYGGKTHRSRMEEDRELLKLIAETPGPKLFADFANQRHSDDLQILLHRASQYDFMPQIIADGVTAKEFLIQRVNKPGYEFLTKHLNDIIRAPKKPEEKIKLVENSKDIIVAPSGMLSAGPIVAYLHQILQNPNGLLVLPGFQAPGTIGEKILKTGRYPYMGAEMRVKAKVYHCKSRSSHADQEDLHTMLESAKPKRTLIVHGDPQQKEYLGDRIQENDISSEVLIPTQEGKQYDLQ